MPSHEEELFQRISDAYISQTAQEAVSEYGIHVPQQELPPALLEKEAEYFRELWKKYHPPPPKPPESPEMLGPFNWDPIYFKGSTPVGGWSQVTLRKSGDWHFTGHLHDSGAPSYDDGVVFCIKDLETDEMFVLAHHGRMHGTFEAGSRNDDWDEQNNNGALAASWDSLCRGWSYTWRCECNADINSIIKAAEQALGDAAKIIAML
jgi:hypothetical protein